jgi:hypothetical protein
MSTQQVISKSFLTRISILIFLFLVLNSCEKYNIKRHYTGNFNFITINTDTFYDGGPYMISCDTISISGSIEYVDDYVLLIKVGNEQYAVNVDSEGNMTLYDTESNDPHGHQSLTGSFKNHNELSFEYYESYSFMGQDSDSERKVTGTRQ